MNLSPIPLHFLILSPFFRITDARMQQVVQPCHPLFTILFNSVHHESNLAPIVSGQWTYSSYSSSYQITLSYSRSIILSFSIPCTIRGTSSSGKCTNCQWTGDIFQGWTPRPTGKGGFPAPPRTVGRRGLMLMIILMEMLIVSTIKVYEC